MTNSPPPDPRSSQRTPLGFDEFIGIFVAFTTIGAIFFWSLSQRDEGFNLTSLLSPSPSPSAQPTPTPTPSATAPPAPVLPVPTVTPTESPEVLTPVPTRTPIREDISVLPVPTRTPIRERIPAVIPLPTKTPVTQAPPTPAPAPPIPPTPAPAPPTPPTPAPGEPIKFVDVPVNFWARPFIDALSARGVVAGEAGDYFRPDRPVTRAEFAALLQDAFDQNPGQSPTGFKDVPPAFWAVRAIDKATQAGFLKGYPGNVFRPQQQIPRAQVLVALASGLNLPTPSSPAQTLQNYKDAAQIPNYATEKIAAATTTGLVVNYPDPTLLNPNRNATRAEVAAIIYQALVQAGKAEPIQSQYVVKQPQ